MRRHLCTVYQSHDLVLISQEKGLVGDRAELIPRLEGVTGDEQPLAPHLSLGSVKDADVAQLANETISSHQKDLIRVDC